MKYIPKICLEGNIGCGKSSLLCRLINHFDPTKKINAKSLNDYDSIQINFDNFENRKISIIITPEPIKLWTNIPFDDGVLQKNDNLLEKMYTDPKRWAFTFEHYCQLTRLNQMISIYDKINQQSLTSDETFIHLMERSIYTNRFCFVENFYQSKILTPVEYEILDRYLNHINKKSQTIVDLFIYLRTDPSIALERIRKRSRKEENTISKEYVNEIHKLHEKIFIDKQINIWNKINCSAPKDKAIICLDGNQLFDNVYDNFISNLRKWIEKMIQNKEH